MTVPGTVEHALLIAQRGWNVFPVKMKTPLTPNGFLDAVRDEAEVHSLWTTHGHGATGIGIATGEGSGVWVLDVDVSDGKGGDDTLADLEHLHGSLPDTYQVITGSGGLHLFFRHQEGVRNSAGKLGPGLDVRGDGGYVIAAGSLHQSGEPYRREVSSPDEVAEAPEWLINLVLASSTPEDITPVAPPAEDIRTWLADEGWSRILVLRSGSEYWRRPGKNRGEHSAVWHPPTDSYPNGYLYNYSPNSPGLEADTLYGTRVDVFAAEKQWLDDFQEFLKTEEPQPTEDDPVESSDWKIMTLRQVANLPPEPPPSVGMRSDDGAYLFYPGKVHTVFGEPGGLKSWLTQVIGNQVISDGDYILIVDCENTPRSIYDRFLDLGLDEEEIDRVHCIKPEEAFTAANRKMVEDAAKKFHYRLIVLDGTTDALAIFGLDPDKGTDWAKFDKKFLKVLARTGAAVVYVDHVTKSREGRNGWGIGTGHKKASIDGASFEVEIISSFGKGMTGKALVYLRKDKNGDLVQYALEGNDSPIAELQVRSDPRTHQIEARITSPGPDLNPDFRPTIIMGRLAAYIEAHPGLSMDVIIKGSGVGDAKKEWVRMAFQMLEGDGYVVADLGDPRDKRYRSVKPYDEMQDGLDHDRHRPKDLTPSQEAGLERIRARQDRTLNRDEVGVSVHELL